MPRKSEQREARMKMATIDRRLSEHKLGAKPSLKIPDGVSVWNPKKDGNYTVDVLPYRVGKRSKQFRAETNHAAVGEGYYERTYFCHFGVGPNNEAVVCLAKTLGAPCYLCEERSRLLKDSADKKITDGLKWKERQLFLIYDHDDTKRGVQLWDISFHLFGKNLDTKIDNARPENKQRYKQFYYPGKDGSTLGLIAAEKSMGPGTRPFLEFTVDEFIRRKAELPEEIENHGVCLDDVPVWLTYDEMKALVRGEADENGEEEDEEKPSRNGRASARARDEEEEEEVEEEEPEEEEEEAPTFAKGDVVSFVYKKKQHTGVVKSIKGELAQVQCDDRDDPHSVRVDDLEPAEEEEVEEEEEPEEEEDAPVTRQKPWAVTGKKKGKAARDEEEEEEVEEEEPEEDEEEPFEPEEDEDEPPPKKRKKR